MEKPNKKPAPAFFCSGQPIPGSYWGIILYKVCKGDTQEAARIFARAHFTKADNVVGWIAKGLKRVPGKGIPYALRACTMEIENPQAFKEWIDVNIFKLQGNRPMARAVRDALLQMAGDIKL